jgi:hypothetical protein
MEAKNGQNDVEQQVERAERRVKLYRGLRDKERKEGTAWRGVVVALGLALVAVFVAGVVDEGEVSADDQVAAATPGGREFRFDTRDFADFRDLTGLNDFGGIPAYHHIEAAPFRETSRATGSFRFFREIGPTPEIAFGFREARAQRIS